MDIKPYILGTFFQLDDVGGHCTMVNILIQPNTVTNSSSLHPKSREPI